MQINEKLYNLGKNIIKILAFIVLVGITIMSFMYQSHVSMDLNCLEKVSFQHNRIWVYIFLVLLMGILILAKKAIEHLNEKFLFFMMTAIYGVIGVILVLGVGTDLRADAQLIYQAAVNFSQGNYSMLNQDGYLHMYSYQLGLVTYERILLKIWNDTRVFFLANLIWVIVINYVLWKISCSMFEGKKYLHNITILVSYLFLPQLFFITFAYGMTVGLAMLMIAIWGLMQYLKKEKPFFFIISIAFTALSCILRSNYMIGAIAISIIYILNALKNKRVQGIVCAVITVAVVAISGKITPAWYVHESGIDIGDGAPKVLWIAMGLRDESAKLGGWYDAYNKDTYVQNGYDGEKSAEEAKNEIVKRLKYFKENPVYAVNFFQDKIESTWCDPLFESIWSGPVDSKNQQLHNKYLKIIYSESRINQLIADGCGAVTIFIYFFTAVFILVSFRRNVPTVWLTGILFFLGGFCFHLLWETKSQYVYPYVFILIPSAVYGFYSVLSWIKKRMEIKSEEY